MMNVSVIGSLKDAYFSFVVVIVFFYAHAAQIRYVRKNTIPRTKWIKSYKSINYKSGRRIWNHWTALYSFRWGVKKEGRKKKEIGKCDYNSSVYIIYKIELDLSLCHLFSLLFVHFIRKAIQVRKKKKMMDGVFGLLSSLS